MHTRFGRTRETAEIALGSRRIPFHTEPLLDDVAVGELEGLPIDDYRTWKRAHTRADVFPGGESLDDAALRYIPNATPYLFDAPALERAAARIEELVSILRGVDQGGTR